VVAECKDWWLREPQPPLNRDHHFPVTVTPKIQRKNRVGKIPLPWRGDKNSKNFWWGGLRKIAGLLLPVPGG